MTKHGRPEEVYQELVSSMRNTAIRTFQAVDAEGWARSVWRGDVRWDPSIRQGLELRVGGIIDLHSDPYGYSRIGYWRIVAMAVAPEGYLSIVAYGATEDDLPKNGAPIPLIHFGMLVKDEAAVSDLRDRDTEELLAELNRRWLAREFELCMQAAPTSTGWANSLILVDPRPEALRHEGDSRDGHVENCEDHSPCGGAHCLACPACFMDLEVAGEIVRGQVVLDSLHRIAAEVHEEGDEMLCTICGRKKDVHKADGPKACPGFTTSQGMRIGKSRGIQGLQVERPPETSSGDSLGVR